MNDTTSNVRKNICASFVSGGDQSVGISAYVDPTCRQEAFVGCFGSTCRHCKVKETPQSKVFLDCPEETPEDLLQNCDSLVSSGDQAVGISAFQDPICLKGAFTGCFGGSCRLCKQKETPQSKIFVNCTSS
jgi:hypothetical protein